VRRRGIFATSVAALLIAPALALAKPPAGAKYTGKTSQGRSVTASVSGSGKGLQMQYREKFTCTGTGSKLLYANFVNDRPTIRSDGGFDYRKSYSGLRDPAFTGTFSEKQHLKGSFSADNRTLKLSSVTSITGKGFSCRSTITVTARRSSG